jgi:Pyruvate/2-oxoacid:ferredoxin oxidoreductase gamma subunit
VTWGRVSLVRLPRTQEILPDIVALGALTELTGMVSLKRQGLQFTKVSLWGTKELNKKAFQAGIKAAKVYLKARDQRA